MGKMDRTFGVGTKLGRGISDETQEWLANTLTGMESITQPWIRPWGPTSYRGESHRDSGQSSVDKHQPEAVVTGAASGIGAACSVMLKDAGYGLLLLDKNEEALRDVAEALDAEFDVVDLSVCVPVIGYNPNVVVCSHGVPVAGRSWEDVIDINLNGVHNTLVGCKPILGGAVVLISSMTGYLVGNKGFKGVASYAASKAALVGMARQLAVEWAEDNIRVNCVLPGPVVTPMTDALKNRNPELYEEFFGRCLLPGRTYPADIAHAVKFLVENPRITGQTIVVDGGYTIQ